MKLRVKTISSVLLVVSLLSGCGVFFGDEGVFRDRSDDYLKTDSIPPVEVPEGINQERFGELYVVPDIDRKEFEYPEEFVVPRPQALAANVFAEKVKIQSLNGKRWVAINTSPAEVWPRVRSFLNTNSLAVAKTNPEEGIIETTWLQFKDDPDNRDRYQLRIEQGVQPDTAEIHVTHVKMKRDQEAPLDVDWPETSVDAERESWMVDEVAASLASDATASSASLLAQTIGGDKKISIISKNREPVLRMDLIFTRARATLNHALDQEGFKLIEENSDLKLVYVTYTDPNESEGFFSGWFSDEEDTEQYTVAELLRAMTVLDTPDNRRLFPKEVFTPTQDSSKKKINLDDHSGYFIIVKEDEGGVDVYIRGASGVKLTSRKARDLLNIIRRNLI
ncbi:MAG: outer membrane protein assembly factor BamC [Cellvibrionaceae bacterium]